MSISINGAVPSGGDGAASSGDEAEDLRREVERLRRRVEELTSGASTSPPSSPSKSSASSPPPGKSGYLFKWQDRSIGWGGTKWGLRFVRLDGRRGRLSYYKSHEERSPRYALTLRDCAVRDEGSKANTRRRNSGGSSGGGGEEGARFHVFSVYQRPPGMAGSGPDGSSGNGNGSMGEEDIVPLLRFSTESFAEKMQWIDLISRACAYCDTEEFPLESGSVTDLNVLERRKTRGTLPKLVFEGPSLARRPSGFSLHKSGAKFRSKSNSKDAARSNNISYPPSKPMHRKAGPSYLSPEEADHRNYRGMFNLLVICLVVSNFRLLQEAVNHHGSVLDKLLDALRAFSWEKWLELRPYDFPFLTGLLVVQATIVGTYVIEKALSRGWVGEWLGMSLHFLITNASLGSALVIVWCLIDYPGAGAVLVMQATITWLKLISYVHANHDYRTASSADGHLAMLALVEDLDAEERSASYPRNIGLGDIYYFWLAPTLTYQIAFPRAPFVRWGRVAALTLHLFIASTIAAFLGGQVIAPNLDALVRILDADRSEGMRVRVLGDYLLKLSISSTYVWLLGFYGFFHCFLNLSAELLRFGDRVFYRDWWNASEVSAYWRLWNMPVHFWLVRHVYFPSVRRGLSKTGATFVVFFVSAVMHEVLISVPCHMIRLHSFLAMMGQMPLIFLTKVIDRRYPGSSIGNVIFWISFCFVGQPMAMLLYTIDYWEENRQGDLAAAEQNESGISMPKIPFKAIGKFFGASSEL
ncbi:hypothetical protein ACHAWF_004681 [Thalassiosira exigua]